MDYYSAATTDVQSAAHLVDRLDDWLVDLSAVRTVDSTAVH